MEGMSLGDLPITLLKKNLGEKFGVMPFLNQLESYKTKFKNLHWSAVNDTIHVRIDGLLDELGDFQDGIAEVAMGIQGQFGPNELMGSALSHQSPQDALRGLLSQTQMFLKSIESKAEYVGMKASVEGFITVLNKYSYLLKLAS